MTENQGNLPEYLKRLSAALALREIPDYPAALAQLQRAVTLAPEDYSVQVLLGNTYQELGETQQAEAHLRQAVSLEPASAEARHALAALLLQKNKPADAIDLLRPVVQNATLHGPSARLMATALAQTGNFAVAESVLQSAYDQAPEDVELIIQLGQLLLQANRPGLAAPILEKAVSYRPTAGLLCDLAAAYSMQGKDDQAIPLLEQAREQEPHFDRAWRGIAYIYLRSDRLEAALDAANRALELNTGHYRNWQIKADILLQLGRRDEAAEVIGRGIELARAIPDAKAVLVNLLATRGLEVLRSRGVDAALSQVDSDRLEFPALTELLRFRFDVLRFGKRFDHALVTLNQMVDQGVPRGTLALDYFLVYHALGQSAEALAALEPLPEDSDERTVLLTDLNAIGVRFYNRGQIQAAQSVFQQMLTIQPDYAGALNNLAFVLSGEGDWAEAEQLLRQALDAGFQNTEVALANLGYVALRQGRITQAIETLRKAEQSAEPNDDGILRVACWYNGAFSDAPHERHPIRYASVLAVVRANLATALYLAERPEDALAMAQSSIDAAPDDSTGYKVMGSIQLALGNHSAARAAWERALQHHQTKQGGALLQEWLDRLPVTN